jgi:hypothetical protein
MSKPPKTLSPKLEVQRIGVNRKGYDRSGAYWGAGPDVFILTSDDGQETITVRARSVAGARKKAQTERERAPGAARVREPIGGASPRTTRYEIDWRDPASDATVKLRISHARDYLSQGSDHVEIESIAPKRAPLPITETGYRSHFMPALELINAGGPVTFVKAWLAREALGKDWRQRSITRQQSDLFQWADAQSEIARIGARPKAPRKAPVKGARTKPEQKPG